MIKTNEFDHDYRFGDHGPKYLMKGMDFDLGVVVLKPHQEFKKHFHAQASETFLTISGEIHMYVNDKLEVLKAGDVLRCEPKESHYVVNKGTENWKAVFIKSPPTEGDSIYVE